jgi:transcriptional regulator with XRE-family HTH domain
MANLHKQFLIFFGKKVRLERQKKDISQEKLGSLADLHRTYIGMIERGEKNITLINMKKIATALGVQVRDLIDF